MTQFTLIGETVGRGRWRQSRPFFTERHSLDLHDPDIGWSSLHVAQIGPLRLGRVCSTGHDIALSEPESASVLVPLSGRVSVETGGRDYAAGAGEALMFSPNSRRTRVEPEGRRIYDTLALLIPPAELEAAAHRMDPRRPSGLQGKTFAARFRTRTGAEAGFASLLGSLACELARVDGLLVHPGARLSAAGQLLESLVGMLEKAGALAVVDERPGPSALRRARLAEEYMRANLA